MTLRLLGRTVAEMPAIVDVDPQARSVWLEDGTRLGFAAARRRGYDVEADYQRLINESRGRHPTAGTTRKGT